MGGHNVLFTPAGPIAVRNDHMQVAPADSTPSGLLATVTDVEYQGTYVLLGLQLAEAPPGKAGVSVQLAEAAFDAQPYAVGDTVRLTWADAHARPLGPGAVRPGERQPAPPPAVDPATAPDAAALPAVAF
ncbi:MAG: Fe3+/spermidine/putrescine ABC transporter ATP-binding protein, partial [Variovorax paradoxus]